MQKKILIVVVAILVIAGGAYAVHHKSKPYSPPTSNSSSYNNSTPSNQKPATTSADIVQTKTASNVGQYLADSNGNALYTYGADSAGKSNCSGSCLYSWPVYGPSSDSSATLPANVTIITRSDNTKQYAYKGLPLYTFTSDSAGQVTGDGLSDFHIAKP